MEWLSHQLARFASAVHLGGLPPSAVAAAKRCILDTVGCTVGGALMTPSRTVLAVAEQMGPGAGAPVMGTRRRLSLGAAIYANAYFANALDFDDTFEVIGHPGATIVPPAWTAAAAGHLSGAELLAAVVAGYEVSTRIGTAVLPTPARARQVIGFSTWQVFGAAAALSRLYGLGPAAMANAFGVAGASAPVPFVRKSGRRERPYAWVKNNYGWTALAGLLAVELTRGGFIGNAAILDGDSGFWVMAGSDRCRWEAFTAGLGQEYWLTRVSFKPYPCCRHAHASIDALCQALAGAPSPAGVAAVRVSSDEAFLRDFMVYRPANEIDAQFSLPYCLAMALLRRPPGYGWLARENLIDPAVLAAADLVHAVPVPVPEGTPQGHYARVEITLQNGDQQAAERFGARGDPDLPLTDQELADKFRHNCLPALGQSRTEQLLEAISKLEQVPDVGALDHLLTPPVS